MAKAPRGPFSDKLWRDALRRAVLKRVEGGQRLDRIAETVVTQAMAGELTAAKEIGDRLDGRPHQSGELKIETTRYVVEVPATVPTEEWEKRFQPVQH